MLGFVIWSLVGCVLVVIGVIDFFAKKPVGFWSNAKAPEVTDVKKYNSAVGKLWCIFGVLFILLGFPLLAEQNSPVIFLSVAGAIIWVILLMAVYELGIVKKYRKE